MAILNEALSAFKNSLPDIHKSCWVGSRHRAFSCWRILSENQWARRSIRKWQLNTKCYWLGSWSVCDEVRSKSVKYRHSIHQIQLSRNITSNCILSSIHKPYCFLHLRCLLFAGMPCDFPWNYCFCSIEYFMFGNMNIHAALSISLKAETDGGVKNILFLADISRHYFSKYWIV